MEQEVQIKLLFFGFAADAVGQRSIDLHFDGTQLGDLRKLLLENYPELKRLADIAFAVNEQYQSDGYELKQADVVAIIPPVSGG
ncbi:molybdopterin synthase sulfur carrier subunit [bacterium]|nr:molybdopterin synthase sulfur carrier subunit [bacterium]